MDKSTEFQQMPDGCFMELHWFGKSKNQWVCELCYPNAKEIGEIAKDYWLILDNGKYSIVSGTYGHTDSHPMEFLDKPYPNPDPNDEHEAENDPILAATLDWMEKADNSYEKWSMPIHLGYGFMDACTKTGLWDKEKDIIFIYWLFDKAGRLIQAYEGNHV